MADHASIGTTRPNQSVRVNRVGLATAVLFGGIHLVWILLVTSGFAQAVLNFVFWLHFIRSGWIVESFEFGRAAGLIAMTGAIGYALGSIFAVIWASLPRASD